MRSMTGFGEAIVDGERYRISASIRSVNHRFLDLVVRLPEEHRSLEKGLAEIVRADLDRGRVEVRISVEATDQRPMEIDLDVEALRRVVEALGPLESE